MALPNSTHAILRFTLIGVVAVCIYSMMMPADACSSLGTTPGRQECSSEMLDDLEVPLLPDVRRQLGARAGDSHAVIEEVARSLQAAGCNPQPRDLEQLRRRLAPETRGQSS